MRAVIDLFRFYDRKPAGCHPPTPIVPRSPQQRAGQIPVRRARSRIVNRARNSCACVSAVSRRSLLIPQIFPPGMPPSLGPDSPAGVRVRAAGGASFCLSASHEPALDRIFPASAMRPSLSEYSFLHRAGHGPPESRGRLRREEPGRPVRPLRGPVDTIPLMITVCKPPPVFRAGRGGSPSRSDMVSRVWERRCSPPEAGDDDSAMVIDTPDSTRAMNSASRVSGFPAGMSSGASHVERFDLGDEACGGFAVIVTEEQVIEGTSPWY